MWLNILVLLHQGMFLCSPHKLRVYHPFHLPLIEERAYWEREQISNLFISNNNRSYDNNNYSYNSNFNINNLLNKDHKLTPLYRDRQILRIKVQVQWCNLDGSMAVTMVVKDQEGRDYRRKGCRQDRDRD